MTAAASRCIRRAGRALPQRSRRAVASGSADRHRRVRRARQPRPAAARRRGAARAGRGRDGRSRASRRKPRPRREMVAQLCEQLGVAARDPHRAMGGKARNARSRNARAARATACSAFGRRSGAWPRSPPPTMPTTRPKPCSCGCRAAQAFSGLAGMRRACDAPGAHVALLRPLLGWRRVGARADCADAGLDPVADPSNDDERFERVRIRRALAESGLARCDGHCARAPPSRRGRCRARLGDHRGMGAGGQRDAAARSLYRPSRRRRAKFFAASFAAPLSEARDRRRQRRASRAASSTSSARGARRRQERTLRGVLCTAAAWRFAKAPPRRA